MKETLKEVQLTNLQSQKSKKPSEITELEEEIESPRKKVQIKKDSKFL